MDVSDSQDRLARVDQQDGVPKSQVQEQDVVERPSSTIGSADRLAGPSSGTGRTIGRLLVEANGYSGLGHR